MRRFLFVILLLVLVVGCSNEESEKPSNGGNESETAETNDSGVKIEPRLLGNAQRLGDLVIAHDYAAHVYVEEEGYDHVPKAFHLFIANKGKEAQSLAFLHDAKIMANETQIAEAMMTISSDYPEVIDAGEVLSLYVTAYSPVFDYSEMNGLQLGDSLYFEMAPFVPDITYVTANTVEQIVLEEPTGGGKSYADGPLIDIYCPEPLEIEMECLENEKTKVYRFKTGSNTVELFVEDDQLTYGTILFEDGLLELFYEGDQLASAKWDDEFVSVATWIQICAQQLRSLQQLTITESEVVIDDSAWIDDSNEASLPAHEIEHYISTVIRPAYESIEKAINSGAIQSEALSDYIQLYDYENMQKIVFAYDEATYSTFYVDGELMFVLKIEPNGELVRHYYKEHELVRILYADGTVQDTGLKSIEAELQGIYGAG